GPWNTSWLALSAVHRIFAREFVKKTDGRKIHPLLRKGRSERASRETVSRVSRVLSCSGRAVFAEQRIKQFFQSAAAAQDARLDRADAAFEHFRYLLVAQTFQVAQDDSAAEDVRYLGERLLHDGLNFARSQLIERRRMQIFDLNARLALFRFSIDRNVF